jgi:hypothetical protein
MESFSTFYHSFPEYCLLHKINGIITIHFWLTLRQIPLTSKDRIVLTPVTWKPREDGIPLIYIARMDDNVQLYEDIMMVLSTYRLG